MIALIRITFTGKLPSYCVLLVQLKFILGSDIERYIALYVVLAEPRFVDI